MRGLGVEHTGSISASNPAAPGSILGFPKIFSEELFIDVAEINQRYFLECGKA